MGFFVLPLELRLQVYSFICPRNITVHRHLHDPADDTPPIADTATLACADTLPGAPISDNQCIVRGELRRCRMRKVPGNHAIAMKGIMGWLLSCKQAYRDILSVLYASPTFHFILPKGPISISLALMPPHSAHITKAAFELPSPLAPSTASSSSISASESISAFHTLLTNVPILFPQLRQLSISLILEASQDAGASSRVVALPLGEFLAPIEEMVARLPTPMFTTGGGCYICIGYWEYFALKRGQDGGDVAWLKLHENKLSPGRIGSWKPVGQRGFWLMSVAPWATRRYRDDIDSESDVDSDEDGVCSWVD